MRRLFTMIKFTASYLNWRIDIEDTHTVSVYENDVLCDNTIAALRAIAEQVGFVPEKELNTRAFGRKLLDFINEGNAPAAPTSAAAPAPTTTKTPDEEPKKERSTPAESFKASSADLARAKVRVYGKAQNRTVLGITHAYMVMYPHAKLEDLRKAFPNEINPTSGVDELFVYATKPAEKGEWRGYFDLPEELLTMGDGKKVQLAGMWTKPTFEKMVAHAKQYDIIVADFEKADGGAKKGGFRLEYLNGYIPPMPGKKKSLWWLWLIIILLLAGLAAFFAFKPKEVIEVEKIVYVERVEEIEKDFNAATFIQGKADLSDDAKFVLHDLEQLMQKHPELKLKLVGHTSSEGDATFNQKLSEARAQAAVDFLVGRGVDASRLSAEGKGSSEPIDENNPEANRRTEFIVIE